LRRYEILDTPPEKVFDDLLKLASQICQTPIGLITFVDGNRQWFKSRIRFYTQEISRDASFCAHTILQDDVMEVPDARADERFSSSPMVIGGPAISYYAGAPLLSPDGHAIGTICVMDRVPRKLLPEQQESLKILGREVITHLELRVQAAEAASYMEESERSEMALRESEERFQRFMDYGPVVAYIKDEEGRFLYVNRRFEVSMGSKMEKIRGKTAEAFIPKEFTSPLRVNDLQVLQENRPIEFIETLPNKDGEVRQWLSFKFPIEDELGRRFLGGVSLDVTEKRKAELLLQESEAAFRELFDEAPVAYHEVDTQGRLTRVNHTELSILGYTAEEMVGQPVWNFIQDRVSPEAIRAKLTGEVPLKTYERTFLRKDGKLIPMLIEERLMKDSEGKVSGIRSTLQDISRRKQIENELAEAMDVALESARVKSQFLANMSHEIRTPMNGIIGMTDLLLDTQMNAKQQDFARTIQASAAGLLHIINDILDFSKMEAGMMRFDTVEFDLREVVESTVEMLAGRALQKGIELQSLVDHTLPERVSGDPGRLRQVLANLTGNAIKFTDRGAVLVEATRQQDEKGQVTICFSIRDTGIGISAEQQSRLFQPFSQADGSTTRKYGGTGLGLAISKQIVEQMGGEIGVESGSGAGSCFWFTAPYGRVESSQSRLANRLAGRRGLVVAPGEWLRRTVIMDLGGCGMEMEGLVDRQHAFQALRGKKTDVLVLDFSRDWSACSDLVRQVRDDESLKGLRIVALAPLDRVPDTHDATIDAWVDKPLRMRALVDAAAGEIAGASQAAGMEETSSTERGPLSSSVRVLLVEDNPVNQKVARQLLRKRGYQNVVVSNGLEALAFLGANDCDIIFMDCQMPVMDGYAATAEIRRREGKDRHTWIVAMTAHSLDGDREKCIAAGMDDYMSKPVKIAALDAVMERYRMVVKEPVVESALASLREMGDEDMIGELVELFLQNAPEHLRQAREAFAEVDLLKMARSIHSLKGSASNFGAQYLCELCARLEGVAHDQQGGEPAFLLDAIEYEFHCVARALELSRNHVS